MSEPVLRIEDLRVALPAWSDRPLAVDGISLAIDRNEILCVVGESGSGKSVMAKSILGLLPAPHVRVVNGAIHFENRNLLQVGEEEMLAIRGGRISMIFQEPMVALNPLMKVGAQTDEIFRVHTGLGAQDRRRRVVELFSDVHLPDPDRIPDSYPHELSGGQRQRVMIAMALALEPSLIIADEPTTALDVTTQAQILALLKELQGKHGTAVMFITHDFGVVAEVADRVVVMRDGKLIESGVTGDVLRDPQADYTKALVAAVPSLHPRHESPPEESAPALALKALNKIYGGRAGLLGADAAVMSMRYGTSIWRCLAGTPSLSSASRAPESPPWRAAWWAWRKRTAATSSSTARTSPASRASSSSRTGTWCRWCSRTPSHR